MLVVQTSLHPRISSPVIKESATRVKDHPRSHLCDDGQLETNVTPCLQLGAGHFYEQLRWNDPSTTTPRTTSNQQSALAVPADPPTLGRHSTPSTSLSCANSTGHRSTPTAVNVDSLDISSQSAISKRLEQLRTLFRLCYHTCITFGGLHLEKARNPRGAEGKDDGPRRHDLGLCELGD